MVRCRSKYNDKAQWVSLSTFGAKPGGSCFQHAADSQKITLPAQADVINFHTSSQNNQLRFSPASRERGRLEKRIFWGLFFLNMSPLMDTEFLPIL